MNFRHATCMILILYICIFQTFGDSENIKVIYNFIESTQDTGMQTGEYASDGIYSKALLSRSDKNINPGIIYDLILPKLSPNETIALIFNYGISDPPSASNPDLANDSFKLDLTLNNKTIFNKTLNSTGWRYQYIDISQFAGKRCEFIFSSTRMSQKENQIHALWGEPQILKCSIPPLITYPSYQYLIPIESVSISVEDKVKESGILLWNNPGEGKTVIKSYDQEKYFFPEKNPHATTLTDNYMYFKVDDTFIFDGSCPHVVIKIEYLDRGQGPLILEYDSLDKYDTKSKLIKVKSIPGAFKEILSNISFGKTYKKKSFTFHIMDARFGNRTNACDFRFKGGQYYIQRVTVSKLYPRLYKTKSEKETPKFLY